MARFVMFLLIMISTTIVGLIISKDNPEVAEKQRVIREIIGGIAGNESSGSFVSMSPDWESEDFYNQEEYESINEEEIHSEPADNSADAELNSEDTAAEGQLEENYNPAENQSEENYNPAENQSEETYDSTVDQVEEDYNPFAQQDAAAAFSKTIEIGTPQHIVTDHFGWDVEHGSDGEGLSIYREFPVAFYMKDGVVKLISWGRSGSFEQWETKEGIGRRSRLEDVKEAYQNFTYEILYNEGSEQPSYVVVDYHTNKLVFELTQNRVSFIFLSSPEMLDYPYVRNTAYTYEE